MEIALSLNALFHPQVAQAVEHADAPLGVHCAFCLPPHLAISSTTVPTILNMRKSVLLASLSTLSHQNVIGHLAHTVATDQSLFNLILSFSPVEVSNISVNIGTSTKIISQNDQNSIYKLPSGGGGPRCSCPQGKKECYFPVQRSCNQFTHCSNNTSYLKTCPQDLRWSTILNKCDWPKSVQCGARPVTSTTSTSTTSECNCPGS